MLPEFNTEVEDILHVDDYQAAFLGDACEADVHHDGRLDFAGFQNRCVDVRG